MSCARSHGEDEDLIRVDLIAAARPNFMKVAPLYRALANESWCKVRLVHTGQHYDAAMSDAFFRDLGLPQPDLSLEIGSGSHAEQTGGVMIAYERACRDPRPDWTVVVGDVNSTVACALAATKLGIRVAHLEAGLRSGDRSMPEEINRIVTDAIADLLWTPSADADENLAHEGVAREKIDRVGNIMIDSLEMMRPKIEARRFYEELSLKPQAYGVMTLHRPANVDHPATLSRAIGALEGAARALPLVFPIHPRTRKTLASAGLLAQLERSGAIKLIEPVGYVDFMSLVFAARLAVTDSGGIQEETTYLGIPCLTLRDTTERPITVSIGTNQLVSVDTVAKAFADAINGKTRKGRIPELWDGQTAPRVAQSLKLRL